jgi:hypothetical protein
MRSAISAITPQIVGDHLNSGPEILFELDHQIEDLRLDGQRPGPWSGSSAIRISGSQESAMAIMARCRMPPES